MEVIRVHPDHRERLCREGIINGRCVVFYRFLAYTFRPPGVLRTYPRLRIEYDYAEDAQGERPNGFPLTAEEADDFIEALESDTTPCTLPPPTMLDVSRVGY